MHVPLAVQTRARVLGTLVAVQLHAYGLALDELCGEMLDLDMPERGAFILLDRAIDEALAIQVRCESALRRSPSAYWRRVWLPPKGRP